MILKEVFTVLFLGLSNIAAFPVGGEQGGVWDLIVLGTVAVGIIAFRGKLNS